MSDAIKRPMRDELIDQLRTRMHHDDGIIFLSADFGAPSLDGLRCSFPSRFINVGIAEQNLVNIATGFALEGFDVFAYAIAPFITMRCYEQIRVNLAITSKHRDMNVNLVGVGAGVSYDMAGPTHHSLEDITIMRALPNIVVFSPSDWRMVGAFTEHALAVKKPKYLRLDGKALPAIYGKEHSFDWKTGFCELRSGQNTCLVSTGYMTHKALRIADKLGAENISVGVVDVYMLQPLDGERLCETLRGYESVLTLEEGFIGRGGMDALVLRALHDGGGKARVNSFGFRNDYAFCTGDREQVADKYGFGDEQVIAAIKKEPSTRQAK